MLTNTHRDREVPSIESEDKFGKYFADVAKLTAALSKDPSVKVGAVLVDPSTRKIISTGFNGYPRGCVDNYISKSDKRLRTVHAEANAILNARCDLTGAHIYVTAAPCASCAGLIIQSGVTVVYKVSDTKLSNHWADSAAVAQSLFNESGVNYVA